MTEEHTPKQITNILAELDLPFSVKKTPSGKTSWTVDVSAANSQVVQVILVAQGDLLYFLYIPLPKSEAPTDPTILSQLLRLNARGDLAKVAVSKDSKLVAWATLRKSVLTKDSVLQELGRVARAGEQIMTVLSSHS